MAGAAARLGVPVVVVRARRRRRSTWCRSRTRAPAPDAPAAASVPGGRDARRPAAPAAVLAGTLAAAEALTSWSRGDGTAPVAPQSATCGCRSTDGEPLVAGDRRPMSHDRRCDVIRRARMRVAEKITDLIGDTPIVRLRTFERDTPGVELWAKCEFMNPGGSVKDRAALPDDPRRHPHRARLTPGQDHHRLDQRQHRRRLLADRRRARLPGHAGDAGQRLVGAAQDHARPSAPS